MTYIPPLGDERDLAERICRERKRRGWSQPELVRRLSEAGCEVPGNAVYRIERHERGVSVNELVALSRVFGLAPGDLLAPADWLLQQRADELLRRSHQNEQTVEAAIRETFEVALEILMLNGADEAGEALAYLWNQHRATSQGERDLAVTVELDDGTPVQVENEPLGPIIDKAIDDTVGWALKVMAKLKEEAS